MDSLLAEISARGYTLYLRNTNARWEVTLCRPYPHTLPNGHVQALAYTQSADPILAISEAMDKVELDYTLHTTHYSLTPEPDSAIPNLRDILARLKPASEPIKRRRI